MIKYLFLLILLVGLVSCNIKDKKNRELEERVEALESQLSQTYVPGLGIIMNSVQTHHTKLWFAAKNENWLLAKFEAHELEERLEDIEKFHQNGKEAKLVEMIYSPIEAVEKSILKNDFITFKENFQQLTNTCNACHLITDHPYVQIKIPDINQFSNQEFSLK